MRVGPYKIRISGNYNDYWVFKDDHNKIYKSTY